jgi:ABC-type sulfate/molybdate transport systems ATPase subunit
VKLRALVDTGVTAVVCSHDPAEAALSDTMIVLERGQVRFQGPPAGRWTAAQLAALRTAAAIGMEGQR